MLLATFSVEVVVANDQVSAQESTVESASVASPKVYSNYYDGYLNLHAQPTSKSQIVGR